MSIDRRPRWTHFKWLRSWSWVQIEISRHNNITLTGSQRFQMVACPKRKQSSIRN